MSFAGVNISAPQNGAVSNSPLHVVANATPNNAAVPITAIQIYLDGGLVYSAPGSSVDTYVNMGYGNHTVVVQAWDAGGGMYQAPVYVTGSGSGVFLSSPGANATVNGSAQVVASAYSPRQITAMQIYDNGNLINQTPGASVNTTVSLSPGSHYLVVQAWDTVGNTFLNPVVVNVPGGEAVQTSTTQTAAGPQAYVPPGAISKLDIDQMSGWESCDTCAGAYGSGPVNPYSMTQWIQTPSLDGQSATFWLGGTTPYGNALWWNQLGGNDGIAHFVYDTYFYMNNVQASQALEFDVNQTASGLKYIFGTECDIAAGNAWRVWDTANARWTASGATCQVNQNSWNHLTWELERVNGMTHFIAVTLNGYRQVVDKYYWAKPWSGSEINVAFQMDGNWNETNYQVWLDKVALYYW